MSRTFAPPALRHVQNAGDLRDPYAERADEDTARASHRGVFHLMPRAIARYFV